MYRTSAPPPARFAAARSVRWPAVLIGLALLLVAPAAAQQERPATPGYVQTLQLFHAALASGDGRAAIIQLAEDVTIFESGGAEMSREEYASHHLGGDTRFAAATTRTLVDQRHGRAGNVAWVTTRSETRGTWNDRPLYMAGTETVMLRRENDEWRIFHIHWSSRNLAEE